jgi:hypothetical protein
LACQSEKASKRMSSFSFTAPQQPQQQAQTSTFGGFGATTGAPGANLFGLGGGATAPKPAATTTSPFGTAAPAQGFGASTGAPATGGFGGFGGGGTSTTGGASTASQDNNVPFTGDTSFSALPHHMQQKIWETHKLIMQHRQHAETVSKFSTQDYGLDQHTKVRKGMG